MALIEYWTISVVVHDVKSSLTLQQVREEMYLSPNVKLSGLNGMACIESEELAKDFLNGCLPILEKRYKAGYEASIQRSCASRNNSLIKQIELDSAVVKARLKTGNFSPNKKVQYSY